MTKHKIKFLPYDREIEASEEQSVIRAALEAGVHVNASCGGGGQCGKCRVIIESGEIEGGISERLSREDVENGYRLACICRAKSDLVVRVPVESEIDPGMLKKLKTSRQAARVRQVDFEDLKSRGLIIPPVEKKYLELPPPTTVENLADSSRIIKFLKTHHNEHRLVFWLAVLRKLPDVIRQADFKITATIVRPVFDDGKNQITNIEPGDTTSRNFTIAVDIGTTTIYGQVINLGTGRILAEQGDYNAQISYGEDVISRLIHAEKPAGLEELHGALVKTINGIIRNITAEAGVRQDEVSSITFAGNTTLSQILIGANPAYIRRSPYVPVTTLYPPIRAIDLGLDLAPHANALLYPSVSSWVGGDIVAGVMGSGIYRSSRLSLYIDIGTNAEIVVGNKDWLACAACSAGPAFEGGGIEFGMRAAEGAIEDFSINPRTLEPMYLTVANAKPRGICGSGLINIVANLFETGIIDNLGKFDRDLKSPRIRDRDGIYEYVLAWKNDAGIDRDIVLTEIDIENLIRAKAAIFSGCQTLLGEVGLGIRDLDRIILAGGFGSHVDILRAMTIGLLPEIDPAKVTYIGNGSLMGARMSALTNRIRKDVVEVLKKMTNFELSETLSFMDRYMAALFLPHTDMDLFSGVKARLNSRIAR